MEYSELIARIVAVIKENGNKEITGDQLQGVLFDMVGSLGSGYQFGGIVTPLSNPGRPDAKMLYLAFEEGEYEHLGGLTLNKGMGIFTFDSAWHLEVIEYTEREYIERAFEERVNKTTAQAEVDLKADELTPAVPPMVEGSARGVLGRSAAARFLYRQTSSGSGAAWLRSIHGRTVSYNQLIGASNINGGTSSSGVTVVNNNDGSVSFTGVATGYVNLVLLIGTGGFIAGHKYYARGGVSSDIWMYLFTFSDTGDGVVFTAPSTDSFQNKVRYRGQSGQDFNNIKIWPEIVDLTQAGLDGIITTPEQFEAWQMEQFGHKGYLGYTPGKLVNVNPTGVLTTGRNVWDEEWELGRLNTVTGQVVADNTRFRTKNLIPVMPGMVLYNGANSRYVYLFIFYYDENKNFILGSSDGSVGYKNNVDCGQVFVVPPGAKYLKFYEAKIGAAPYNHDICINISDQTFNGQYVPYNGVTVPLDFTEHFPTGANGVNGIYDEVGSDENGKFTDGGKRFGVVDLGDLSYAKTSDGMFRANISDMKAPTTNTERLLGFVCSKYPADTQPSVSYADSADKTMKRYNSITTTTIFIKDSAYIDATPADFKAAMSGIPLIYELATPQHVTFTDPSDAVYPVAEGGTEQVLPVNGKVPTTISPDMTLQMPRILGKETPTMGTLDNFLAAIGPKIGKTITKEWDPETHSYQFEIQ